jgi:hypothetical protein
MNRNEFMNNVNQYSGMVAKNRTEHNVYFPVPDLSKLCASSTMELRWFLFDG